MMTQKELHNEFWLLTKGILQDSRIDTEEARVIKRWLEEHQKADEFAPVIKRIESMFADGYVDRFESRDIIDSLGHTLAQLRSER